MPYVKVDYDALRNPNRFSVSASVAPVACMELAGVPIKDYFLKPSAVIDGYRRGRAMAMELFGPDVRLPGIATPHISYGHVNCLGSRLIFPDGGEVGHTHIYDSLQQGAQELRRPIDFASSGMAPFYLNFRKQLQRAFPDEPVGWGFGLEGPITTGYELRGDAFFVDVMEDPQGAADFLAQATDSILQFHSFCCGIESRPPINPKSSGMADDIASFIPPRLWPQIVLPAWDRYYRGRTSGRRSAHVEDLRPEQLFLLEEIGLSSYDPSISPKLNPRIIHERCRVPFTWRLAGFHYRDLRCQDVADFVFQAAADGASGVSTVVEQIMCDAPTAEKVRVFIRAGRQVVDLLRQGASRDELRQHVSAAGREKLWDQWPPGKQLADRS